MMNIDQYKLGCFDSCLVLHALIHVLSLFLFIDVFMFNLIYSHEF
jgi:hypothetical protein